MVKRAGNILKSIAEIAAHLGINEKQVQRFCLQEDFPAVQINGKGPWRSEKTALDEWWAHTVRQNHRHPDNKRRRPEEAPDVTEVKNRLHALGLQEIETRDDQPQKGNAATFAKKQETAKTAQREQP